MNSNVNVKVGMRTPWGKADSVSPVAEGIYLVGTPGHGGFKLNRYANSCVNQVWRAASGWYEEDCRYAIVAVTFQQNAGFSCENVERAHQLLRDYYPEEYAQVYGKDSVNCENSRGLREQAARCKAEGQMQITSCWGDWATNVRPGTVGVFARVNGREGAPGVREGYFLITEEQYRTGRSDDVRTLPEDAEEVKTESRSCPFRSPSPL